MDRKFSGDHARALAMFLGIWADNELEDRDLYLRVRLIAEGPGGTFEIGQVPTFALRSLIELAIDGAHGASLEEA